MTKIQKKFLVTGLVMAIIGFGGIVYTKSTTPPSCPYGQPFPCDTNVFVGKIIRHIGDESPEGSVRSQYIVDVIENLKGDLHGHVIVDESRGGIEGVDPLLPIGNTYGFRTKYNKEKGWYSGSTALVK